MPPATVVVFGGYFAAALLYTRFLMSPGPIEIQVFQDGMALGALISFFYVIRVFDEHFFQFFEKISQFFEKSSQFFEKSSRFLEKRSQFLEKRRQI